jgi:hypothetical protein
MLPSYFNLPPPSQAAAAAAAAAASRPQDTLHVQQRVEQSVVVPLGLQQQQQQQRQQQRQQRQRQTRHADGALQLRLPFPSAQPGGARLAASAASLAAFPVATPIGTALHVRLDGVDMEILHAAVAQLSNQFGPADPACSLMTTSASANLELTLTDLPE